MLSIDLVWIARTPDIAPTAPQIFSWNYVRDNIRFVIETRGLGTTFAKVLRVYHYSQILYDIPIQDLIEEGKLEWASLKHTGAEARAEQLPISGKAKYPSIALRYVLPVEGKIRRLQFKFASINDYDQALSYLQELGLHIEAIPSNSAPQSDRVPCPPSQHSDMPRRPSTANSPRFPPQAQLREAAVTRPLSAQPMTPGLAPKFRPSSPLRSSFTASSVSVDDDTFLSAGTSYRPSSATRPDTPALLFDQASELPPRRELPFRRPESSPKCQGNESIRTSSRHLPALPKPTVLNDIPPLTKPAFDLKDHTSPVKTPGNKRGNDRTVGNHSRASSAVSSGQDGLLFPRPNAPRPPSSSSIVYDRPLSAASVTSEQQRSVEAQDRLSTPLTSDSTDPHNFESTFTNNNAFNYQNACLTRYATQSDEERSSLLNQALLEYLENPDFLTLVSDIETAWVRIAPGYG
ncbi:hypothetical protein DM02DRAFT_624333 [Periconia macrospinosa]|uniref:Uncharacterized protein n=1 Tax=Periconia macrospinosa TaxID=97972 RepID=A0A2V1E3K5_9PLEO|nr:hypothetical protein DM02DRAFT_624333 [Periconia macrospinosa]